MTTLQLLIVCLTVLLLALGALAAVLDRNKHHGKPAPVTPSRFAGLKAGQQVGVQLLDSAGQSIKGVIAEIEPEYLELTTAELVVGRDTTPLGNVRVAASVVQVLQRIRAE